jgi:magnesium transporter
MIEETTEDVQKFGGMEALDEPYMKIGFAGMIRKRAGWLSILLLGEMLTASAMQHFEDELEKAIVLTLFIPLIMSSGGNSGSQATSLIIRALALRRDQPEGLVAGAAARTADRADARRHPRRHRHRAHRALAEARHLRLRRALDPGRADGRRAHDRHRHLRLAAGSMLPFVLKRLGFDPASASAPFVATLVDVTGLVIYFGVALATAAASSVRYPWSLPMIAPRRGLGVPGNTGWRNGSSEKDRITCPSEALGIRR